jgi:YidC/Oxa1 family membrane protein insertase
MSQKNAPSLFSRTPSRPVRSCNLSLAAIGHRNISLWPFSKSQEGLGFTPPPNATREGTPDTTTISASQPSPNDAAASVSTSAQAPTPTSPAEPLMQSTPLPLDPVDEVQSLLDSVQSTVIAEDHIGFLKEMGIQYGFPYFTNSLQFLMEHIHVYAGTPWWATIVVSAITIRALLAVPFALGSHHGAKMAVIQPYLEEAKGRMQIAAEGNDILLKQQVTQEMQGLKNAIGLKMSWVFVPVVVQGILGFCAFKFIRAMALLPVPGLETGGFSWLTDLTIPDPTFIIPITMGITMHLIARVSQSIF